MRAAILHLAAVVFISVIGAQLCAQEYIIGPDDELSITFWQQPNLNTVVRVTKNGTINLPVIGTIKAAGLTSSALANKIVDKISIFNRRISQASVIVTNYGSKSIYVTGYVNQPGKYSFEVIPNLWKIILEAGGPAETAKLDAVTVIRAGKRGEKKIAVDLAEYVNSGDDSMLPPIYPGDTIHIPGVNPEQAIGASGAPGGVISTAVSEDIIYIYGQVARPGGYQFTQDLTLLEAIVIAGGPTQMAKLNDVRIITKGTPYSTVASVDLEKYSRDGAPIPFLLKPGDTIFIPQQKSSSVWTIFQRGIVYDILRLMITASTSIIIYSMARR